MAELKQAGELLPNQALLINMLPMLDEIAGSIRILVMWLDFAEDQAHADNKAKIEYEKALTG